MNDDDVERRLRRALHVRAHRMVADSAPVPVLSTGAPARPPVRRFALIATVAAVVLIGALALVLSNLSGNSIENLPQPPATESLRVDTTAPVPSPDATPSASVPRSPVASPKRTTTGTSGSGHPSVVTSVPVEPLPSSDPPSPTHPHQQPIPTHSHSASSTPTPHPSSSAKRTPPARVTSCRTSDLSVTLDHSSGSAGGGGAWFRFENHSALACSLDGFPTLYDLDAAGDQVGPDASRSGSIPEQPVVLLPRQQAEFHLGVTDGGVPGAQGPNCPADWSSARTTEIVPPGQTAALSYRGAFGACDPTVTVVYRPS